MLYSKQSIYLSNEFMLDNEKTFMSKHHEENHEEEKQQQCCNFKGRDLHLAVNKTNNYHASSRGQKKIFLNPHAFAQKGSKETKKVSVTL